MMSCLCSTETTALVKEIMLDWITPKKIKEDNTWSEEGLDPPLLQDKEMC